MAITPKRILKVIGWILGVVALLVLAVALYVQVRWDAKQERPVPALVAPKDSAAIARGEYIFKYQAQCWGCHAALGSDAQSAPSGGQAFDLSNVGPGFGIWYARNITPDVETGIGGWTDGEIVQAIREGVNKDRMTLFPVMPTDWYHGLSDEDALAIVAYLRSIPPLKNTVSVRTPSFFAKALFTFGVLKPKAALMQPVTAPPPGVTAAYGKYVAENRSGCIDCHTPRNLQTGEFFLDSLGAGSSIEFGEAEGTPLVSFARNITPDKETGIGEWSEEQFLAAVTKGMRPDGSVLSTHMPYAYYKFLTEQDLKAVFLYLKSLPPIKRSVPPTKYSRQFSEAKGVDRGKLLFTGRCQSCHGQNGKGATPTNVKLAEVAASLNDEELKAFIREGALDLKMPSFGKTLKEDELVDVVAFIRSWETK